MKKLETVRKGNLVKWNIGDQYCEAYKLQIFLFSLKYTLKKLFFLKILSFYSCDKVILLIY